MEGLNYGSLGPLHILISIDEKNYKLKEITIIWKFIFSILKLEINCTKVSKFTALNHYRWVIVIIYKLHLNPKIIDMFKSNTNIYIIFILRGIIWLIIIIFN